MIYFRSFALILLVLIQTTASAGPPPGPPGAPPPIKIPDKFGSPCQGALIELNYGCEKNGPSMCQCQNLVFQKTAVYCVDSRTKDELERMTAYEALLKPCKKFISNTTFERLSKQLNLAEFVQVDPNMITTQIHTRPFFVPIPYMMPFFRVNAAKMARIYNAHRFGDALFGYWAGVFFLRAIVNFVHKYAFPLVRACDTKAIRKLRKNIILPPTFRYKHTTVNRVLLWFTYTIPVRFQSLILIGYIVTHLVLYFVEIPIIMPNYFYKTVPGQIVAHLAYRTGIFALCELILLAIFGGRNNILIAITGWPLDTFNVFHRWVGRFFVLDASLHGIFYTISAFQQDKYAEKLAKPFFQWGIVSTALGGAILIQSLYMFRSRRYELFLALHQIFSAVIILGIFCHLGMIHSEPLYIGIAGAILGIDSFIRTIRTIISGVNSKGVARLYPDGIIKIKIRYSNWWKPHPGVFAFFKILKGPIFWQAHPFTIIESPLPEDVGKLVLIIRVKEGMTRRLRDILEKKPDRTDQLRMLIEGPYGSDHKISHYENVVMVAGGIGVTGVYTFASSLRKNTTNSNKRFVFIWCIGSEAPLQWFSDELNYLAEDDRFDVRVYINPRRQQPADVNPVFTEELQTYASENYKENSLRPSTTEILKYSQFTTRYDKVNIRGIVYEEMMAARGALAFLCCGPGGMNDDVRVTISKNLEATRNRVDYFEESFSW